MKTAHIKEGLVLAFAPPPIFGLGNAGGFEFYIQNRGEGGPQRLAQEMGKFLAAANKDPQLAGVQTLWRAGVPQLHVGVDREKAKALGVPLNDLFDTLSATLGSYYVNEFNKFRAHLAVLMSAEPSFRMRPDSIGGALRAFGKKGNGATQSACQCDLYSGRMPLDRFNKPCRRSNCWAGAPGVSSGQAIQWSNVSPTSAAAGFRLRLGWRLVPGEKIERTSRSVGLAAVWSYLILAAQYEKWSLPLSVMMALPIRYLRGAGRGVADQTHQRRLLPDRPGDAFGPCRKECDPFVEYAISSISGLSPSAAA